MEKYEFCKFQCNMLCLLYFQSNFWYGRKVSLLYRSGWGKKYNYLEVRKEWCPSLLKGKQCRDSLIRELMQFCACNQSGVWGSQYDETDIVQRPKDLQIHKRLAKRKGSSFYPPKTGWAVTGMGCSTKYPTQTLRNTF